VGLQVEGVYPVDSKFCTRCGYNNGPHALKCQKCLAVLVMTPPRSICWVFVQLIPKGGECEECRIRDRKFWYTYILKDDENLLVVFRYCADCYSRRFM
jgi:hypothetical protein